MMNVLMAVHEIGRCRARGFEQGKLPVHLAPERGPAEQAGVGAQDQGREALRWKFALHEGAGQVEMQADGEGRAVASRTGRLRPAWRQYHGTRCRHRAKPGKTQDRGVHARVHGVIVGVDDDVRAWLLALRLSEGPELGQEEGGTCHAKQHGGEDGKIIVRAEDVQRPGVSRLIDGEAGDRHHEKARCAPRQAARGRWGRSSANDRTKLTRNATPKPITLAARGCSARASTIAATTARWVKAAAVPTAMKMAIWCIRPPPAYREGLLRARGTPHRRSRAPV